MANKGLELVRDIGTAVTSIVVGMLLIGGTVSLAIIGAQGNIILGWAMVVVGIIDLIVSFR